MTPSLCVPDNPGVPFGRLPVYGVAARSCVHVPELEVTVQRPAHYPPVVKL